MDSTEDMSDMSTKERLNETQQDWVTLIKRRHQYHPSTPSRLRNNLLIAVGFLELGNAGDFAANVWNEIPPPTFAMVLMAVGGTFALVMSIFAIRDALRSWRNIQFLRGDRYYLQKQRTRYLQNPQTLRSIDALMHTTFRELGQETVERFGMDVFMGFGAILVGTGTLMAMGGTDPNVYLASNLLSGYIGNGFPALYGLFNASWSIYMGLRVRQHHRAIGNVQSDVVRKQLKHRLHIVLRQVLTSCTTVIVAAAGSLISSTMWWGYPILIPCIISSIYLNFLWRRKLAYQRPYVQQLIGTNTQSLIQELEFAALAKTTLKENPQEALSKLAPDSTSISSLVDFILHNDLLEAVALQIANDATLSKVFANSSDNSLTIHAHDLSTLAPNHHPHFHTLVQKCIAETGRTHFQHRQRYLSEIYFSFVCAPRDPLATPASDLDVEKLP